MSTVSMFSSVFILVNYGHKNKNLWSKIRNKERIYKVSKECVKLRDLHIEWQKGWQCNRKVYKVKDLHRVRWTYRAGEEYTEKVSDLQSGWRSHRVAWFTKWAQSQSSTTYQMGTQLIESNRKGMWTNYRVCERFADKDFQNENRNLYDRTTYSSVICSWKTYRFIRSQSDRWTCKVRKELTKKEKDWLYKRKTYKVKERNSKYHNYLLSDLLIYKMKYLQSSEVSCQQALLWSTCSYLENRILKGGLEKWWCLLYLMISWCETCSCRLKINKNYHKYTNGNYL